MEEITINEEAGDAEVIDRNTNVDHETIKKWRSLIVTDDYGNEHNKHFLVRSFLRMDYSLQEMHIPQIGWKE